MSSFAQMDGFPVMTPYGMATCIGFLDQDDIEWMTWNEKTQEMWSFTNRNIRRRCNASNGLLSYSPFTQLNRTHLHHIKRYIASGWLSADYDPLKPETWPL